MNWLYLLLAGMTEIGWPIGLKMAQSNATKWPGITLAIVFLSLSGSFLYLAQRTIAMGTAYSIWTGIGAAGTFFIGIGLYGEPTSMLRYLGIVLILSGVIALKLGH